MMAGTWRSSRSASQAPLLDIAGTPRQLRGPAQLALDLLDEVADLRRCGIRLLALDANEERLLLAIGKPDVEEAVGNEGSGHDAREQQDVLPKEPAATADRPYHRGPDARLLCATIHLRALLCGAKRTAQLYPSWRLRQ